MRLFQNSTVYRSYLPRLAQLTRGCQTFNDAIGLFLDDRFGAAHFLQPVLDRAPEAFFTNGDDETSQRLWAKSQGLAPDTSLAVILLAQIEHHRTEVFYNLDPVRYGDTFLKRLPASVRRTVAWRAAPSANGEFLAHDIIVNNFPSLLEGYRAQGVNAQYLAPAHDPVMDVYAARIKRPVDVLFVGTYSRHHRVRAALLEEIAAQRDQITVAMHLDTSRYTKLAESPLGWVGPLRKDRRSRDIRAVTRPPVFGRDLLEAISQAKIVINGAIDMAGRDRGNMRIWEALGCGAALISDEGIYPPGMEANRHFKTYSTVAEVRTILTNLIQHPDECRELAANGNEMIKTCYDKNMQWLRFQNIVA